MQFKTKGVKDLKQNFSSVLPGPAATVSSVNSAERQILNPLQIYEGHFQGRAQWPTLSPDLKVILLLKSEHEQPAGMPHWGLGRIDFKTTEGESTSSPQAMPLQSGGTCQGSSGCTDPGERAWHTPSPTENGTQQDGNGSKHRKPLGDEPALVFKDFISKSYCSNILVLTFQTYSIASQAIPHQSCIQCRHISAPTMTLKLHPPPHSRLHLKWNTFRHKAFKWLWKTDSILLQIPPRFPCVDWELVLRWGHRGRKRKEATSPTGDSVAFWLCLRKRASSQWCAPGGRQHHSTAEPYLLSTHRHRHGDSQLVVINTAVLGLLGEFRN